MNFLQYHILNIVQQDLILTNIISTSTLLPKFSKVTLSAKFSGDFNGAILSLFEVLTFNKPTLTLSRVNNLTLNLRKGQLAGCKIALRKKHILDFLERFVFEILPSFKKIESFKFNNKYLIYQLKDLFVLEEANNIYMYLQSVTTLDVVIETNKPCYDLFLGIRLPLKTK